MKGAASLRSSWISTENGNPSDAKPQKQPQTRLKRLDGWTVRLRKVSIKSIIYDLAAPKQKVWKVTGCAKRTKNVHDVHLLVEFSECRVGKLRIDPQSRAKLQNDVQIFQMFFIFFMFFLVRVLHVKCFMKSVFGGSEFIKSVPLDLGGGLQKAPRRGMGCTGMGCTPVVPVVLVALRIFGGEVE